MRGLRKCLVGSISLLLPIAPCTLPSVLAATTHHNVVSIQKQNILRSSVLKSAYQFEGLHYDWGGTSPRTGFDCSGFIQYIFDLHGISLPRTASEQATVGRPIPLKSLRPGDLMFFRDTYSNQLTNQVTHVALYIGDGDVIESSSVDNKGVVVIHNILNNPWYASRYYGARDVFSL